MLAHSTCLLYVPAYNLVTVFISHNYIPDRRILNMNNNFILTVLPIVSYCDPIMHYKCWYIGSLLQKAWWWLSTVGTCCCKCNRV